MIKLGKTKVIPSATEDEVAEKRRQADAAKQLEPADEPSIKDEPPSHSE